MTEPTNDILNAMSLEFRLDNKQLMRLTKNGKRWIKASKRPLFKSRHFTAAQIAYFLQVKLWPNSTIHFRDRDPSNLSIDNMRVAGADANGEVKTCSMCWLTKPTDAFYRDEKAPGRLHSSCYDCSRAQKGYVGPKRVGKYVVHSGILTDETALSFYLLGAFMTDGCVFSNCNTFELCSKDVEWLEHIATKLSPDKPIYTDKRSNGKTLRLTNEDASKWLMSWGCLPRKSQTLSITKEIPVEFRRDFLRGVIDGDGSISILDCEKRRNAENQPNVYTRAQAYICSGSRAFIMDLEQMIPDDINHSVYKQKPSISSINGRHIISEGCWRLTFQGTNARKLLSYVYYDGAALTMKRKADLAKQAAEIQPRPRRKGFVGPNAGKKRVYNEDGSYRYAAPSYTK